MQADRVGDVDLRGDHRRGEPEEVVGEDGEGILPGDPRSDRVHHPNAGFREVPYGDVKARRLRQRAGEHEPDRLKRSVQVQGVAQGRPGDLQ